MTTISKQPFTEEQLKEMKQQENKESHISHYANNNPNISYNALLFRETFLAFAKQSGIPSPSKYFYDFFDCNPKTISKQYDNIIANGYMGKKFREKLADLGLKEKFYNNYNCLIFPTSSKIHDLLLEYIEEKEKKSSLHSNSNNEHILSDFRYEFNELIFFHYDEQNKDLIELARKMMHKVFENHFDIPSESIPDKPNAISQFFTDLTKIDFNGENRTPNQLLSLFNDIAQNYHEIYGQTDTELVFKPKPTNYSSNLKKENIKINLLVIRETYLILSKKQQLPDAENRFYKYLKTTKEDYENNIKSCSINSDTKNILIKLGIPSSCFDSRRYHLLYMSETIYNAYQYAETNPPLFHALIEINLLYVPNGDNALLLILIRQLCRRIHEAFLSHSDSIE